MSIFSSIGSAVKSAYNTVKSGISSAVNYVTGNSTSASSINALNYNNPANNALQAKYTANPGSSPVSQYARSGSGNTSIPSYATSTVGYSQPAGPQLPVSINAGQQKTSSGGGSSYGSISGGGTYLSDYAPAQQAPRTITSSLMGGPTNTASRVSGGGTVSQTPLTLSSSPTSVNPGGIDNTKMAGALAGYYKLNDKGVLELDTTKSNSDQAAEDAKSLFDKYYKEPGLVSEDPEVVQARQQRQQIQQALQAPTSELNAVIAKQNQDLLQLRQTGSQEGVTEAVYGGQTNAINYNAAIRALPLQASIASLQGDLKLAQDYLTELTAMKTEQINRQSKYNEALFSAISGAVTKSEERAYEELKTANANKTKTVQDNVAAQDAWSKIAIQNGQGNLIKSITNLDSSSPDFTQQLGQITSGIVQKNTEIRQLDNGQTVVIDKNTNQIVANLGGAKIPDVQPGENPQLYSGLSTGTATAVRSVVSKYGTEPTIQNFATVQDGYNFAKSLKTNTKNPADDQALIYSLAKTLDPGSVVREGEYATAQKYAQSWIVAYGKGVTQALAGTGFLSETARNNIKKTIEQKYNSSKVSYNNQYKEFTKQINNLTGRDDGEKFIRNYVTDDVSDVNDIDYTSTLDNIFK